MSSVAYAEPVIYADESSRISYLRRVAVLTGVGLAVSFGTATVAAFAFAVAPLPQIAIMAIVFGSFMGAQYGGQAMINSGARYPGFFMGSILQGVAMGYLLLAAAAVSASALGNPFMLIGEAIVLVALTAMGMIGYLLSGPKNLSLVRAGMATFGLPMFALMIMSLFWAPGGIFGVLIHVAGIRGVQRRRSAVRTEHGHAQDAHGYGRGRRVHDHHGAAGSVLERARAAHETSRPRLISSHGWLRPSD